MIKLRRIFDAVWLIDFEFSAPTGERPRVVCLVGREYFSKKLIRIFDPDFGPKAPFDLGDRAFQGLGPALPLGLAGLYFGHE